MKYYPGAPMRTVRQRVASANDAFFPERDLLFHYLALRRCFER